MNQGAAWKRAGVALMVSLAALLAVLTAAVFSPVRNYAFTNYDEVYQIIDNPMVKSLSPANIAAMFSNYVITSYYPVRLLSYAIDYQLWGLNGGGFHVTNLLIHIANTILLFLFLIRLGAMAGRGTPSGEPAKAGKKSGAPRADAVSTWRGTVLAALAVTVFAVHPVVVEVVGWVSCREELLMMFFGLACMHVFVTWTGRGLILPAVAFLFMLLSCLCNAVGSATALFLSAFALVYARLGKDGEDYSVLKSCLQSLRRTWPYWVLAIAIIVLKKYSDHRALLIQEGPMQNVDMNMYKGRFEQIPDMTVIQRVAAVAIVYAMNLRTIVWPGKLAMMYPSVDLSNGATLMLMAAGFVLAAGTLFLLWRAGRAVLTGKRRAGDPLFLFGLLWFLLALLPSAQVMPHHTIRADRFLYPVLPGLGVMIYSLARRPRKVLIPCILLTVIALAFAARSHQQLPVWTDSISLYKHSLMINEESIAAHNNLANALAAAGSVEEAIQHYRRALELNPDWETAHLNLGISLIEAGDLKEGLSHVEKALKLSPKMARAHNAYGAAMTYMGKLAEAELHYREATRIDPTLADSHSNLGVVLAMQGKYDEAIGQYLEAITLNPDVPDTHSNLAGSLIEKNRLEEAVAQCNVALKLKPDSGDAHFNLGVALLRLGRFDDAAAHFLKVLEITPDDPDTRMKLGEAYEGQGKVSMAVAQYNAVLQRKPDHAEARARLASLSVPDKGSTVVPVSPVGN